MKKKWKTIYKKERKKQKGQERNVKIKANKERRKEDREKKLNYKRN